jgi:uncharacterized Zn finger protein
MKLPPISETLIQEHATANSFDRGKEYQRAGSVVALTQRGNQLQAEVEGTEVQPYRVTIQFDTVAVSAAQCTCPYDYGGWCKHIVATLLTYSHQPNTIEERPTLVQLLDRLDHVQTQRLIQALVAEQPELIDTIDRHVSLLTSPVPQQKKSQPRRSPIDVTPFRRQVKHILRSGIRELEDGYEDDPFSDELLDVIDKARAFSENGDGNSAIAILEAITATYAEEWDELTDYGGDVYSIAEHLNEAWTEAILNADLDSAQAVDLRVMLETWQDEIDADLGQSLAALQQGWEHPVIQAMLAGTTSVNALWDGAPPNFADDLALIRLQILDRQNRETEYLNFARAAGLKQQHMTRLVASGQVDTALEAWRNFVETATPQDPTAAATAFALAQTLQEGGYLTEALNTAQAGLAFPGQVQHQLANWTGDLAETLGATSIALTARILAFKTQPSFREYRKVEALAAESWTTIKQELLETLRRYREWQADDAKVDIFLHEGLIDDAIRVVNPERSADVYSGYIYRKELVYRVMDAALSVHPDWVIDLACRSAEAIMNAGKSDRYAEAIQWLKKAHAAYLNSDRQKIWEGYFTNLKTTHAKKRKLIALFGQIN